MGKFSKKCSAFLNSIILSNYRPLTTFILSFHPWARLRRLHYRAITQSAGYGRTYSMRSCACRFNDMHRVQYDLLYQNRGGSRREACPPPPLFLDQTEARRADKFFFGDQPFSCPNPPPPVISRSGSTV